MQDAKREQEIGTVTVMVHDESFSAADIIINPKFFPSLKLDDIISISSKPKKKLPRVKSSPNPIETKEEPELQESTGQHLCLKLATLDPVKGNLKLSLLNNVAIRFGLVARQEVIIRLVAPESIALSHIELSFKNQYVGRCDMRRIHQSLVGKCLYEGETLMVQGQRLYVEKMAATKDTKDNNISTSTAQTRGMRSGLVLSTTICSFRSRSACVFLLVQMSAEMWNFADDGELYYEKVVGFLRVLFQEWQKVKVSHSLQLVFFSRTYYENQDYLSNDELISKRSFFYGDMETFKERETKKLFMVNDKSISVQYDEYGRPYNDFYKVVADSEAQLTCQELDQILLNVKKELVDWPSMLKWFCITQNLNLLRVPSKAIDGNVIEAITCAISVFETHYIDRALDKTGQNMILISAGSGVFTVSRKLTDIVKQKMIDNGIGCDLVSMQRPPCHRVPLFIFSNLDNVSVNSRDISNAVKGAVEKKKKSQEQINNTKQRSNDNETKDTDNEAMLSYYIPEHWIAPFFFDYQCLQKQLYGGIPTESVANWGDSALRNLGPEYLTSSYDQMFRDERNVNITKNINGKVKKMIKKTNQQKRRKIEKISELDISDEINQDLYDKKALMVAYNNTTEHVKSVQFDLEYVDPFEPWVRTNKKSRTTQNRRRWAHLYGTIHGMNYSILLPNWISLTQPAFLPLTTDYFPTSAELSKEYQMYNYSLSLVFGDNDYHDDYMLLIDEMVNQRQAMDYQYVVNNENMLRDKQRTRATRSHYFSINHQFHRIAYFEKEGVVRVTRFVAKKYTNAKLRLEKIPYTYFMYSTLEKGFVMSERNIMPSGDMFDWSYVDHMLCGEYSDLMDSSKYRRMRFAIVPSSELAAELMIVGDEEVNNIRDTKRKTECMKMQKLIQQLFNKSLTELNISVERPKFESLSSSSSSTTENKIEEEELELPTPDKMTSMSFQRATERNDRQAMDIGFGNSEPMAIIKIPLNGANKTRRFEWCQIGYDTKIEPSCPFFIEVGFLIATGCEIESWIKNFFRIGKRIGLTIKQIPTRQTLRTSNCFVVPIVIPMESHIMRKKAILYLIKECKFILRQQTRSFRKEYLHERCLALVRVRSVGLVWVQNHLVKDKDELIQLSLVFDKFSKYCCDLMDQASVIVHDNDNNVESKDSNIDNKNEDGIETKKE